MPAWRRLTFSIPSTAQEDLIARLHELGTLGLETIGDNLAAWFPDTLDETSLILDLERSPGFATGLRLVASEPVADGLWQERWMESLKPFDLGERFLVVPGPVTPPDTRGRRVIRLTPGRAFGTGEHATTRMCLAMIERTLPRGGSLLDVGTGSGILAIAALLLGAASVVGIDTDDTAIMVAARNARLNGAGGIQLIAGTVDALRWRTFDLVVGNISGPALVRLMAPLAAMSSRHTILSGILNEEERDVIGAGAGVGLSVTHRMAEGEWVALMLARRGHV